MNEQFKCAATKYRGRIYEGVMHPLIYEEIKKEHPEASYEECDKGAGFITRSNRFLDRSQAMSLAAALDLVGPRRPGEVSNELYTEDLPFWALKGNDGEPQ